ncbi:uncharacterized protein BX664DRAFT_323606 [Halteromyces radiatus]|uniref:uncharacterized protein n=1 Tax=Halteromyces radiatus TaxID=101107 RepID=UPI002221129C|nr:uncharacterized protein BX664DRAFT_323606 [Halteromyces radiatus]KAI8096312.1 hypothetical protein BX664DRAFT_323606 [Halteromyces radiatus]
MSADSNSGRFPKKYSTSTNKSNPLANTNSPRTKNARSLTTGSKVSAPKPINLPSLRHEHASTFGSPDSTSSLGSLNSSSSNIHGSSPHNISSSHPISNITGTTTTTTTTATTSTSTIPTTRWGSPGSLFPSQTSQQKSSMINHHDSGRKESDVIPSNSSPSTSSSSSLPASHSTETNALDTSPTDHDRHNTTTLSSPPPPSSAWSVPSSVSSSKNASESSDFHTTIEIVTPKPLSSPRNERAKVIVSHHAKPTEIPMPFTEASEPSSMSWDEMVSEEMDFSISVVEFADGTKMPVDDQNDTEVLDNDNQGNENEDHQTLQQQPVLPSDRFTEDYDRSYPPKRRPSEHQTTQQFKSSSYRHQDRYHHHEQYSTDRYTSTTRTTHGKWNTERRESVHSTHSSGSGHYPLRERRPSSSSSTNGNVAWNNGPPFEQRRLSQDRPYHLGSPPPTRLLVRRRGDSTTTSDHDHYHHHSSVTTTTSSSSLYTASDDRPPEMAAAQREAMLTAAEQAKKRREADEAERQAAAERARQKALALAPPLPQLPKTEEVSSHVPSSTKTASTLPPSEKENKVGNEHELVNNTKTITILSKKDTLQDLEKGADKDKKDQLENQQLDISDTKTISAVSDNAPVAIEETKEYAQITQSKEYQNWHSQVKDVTPMIPTILKKQQPLQQQQQRQLDKQQEEQQPISSPQQQQDKEQEEQPSQPEPAAVSSPSSARITTTMTATGYSVDTAKQPPRELTEDEKSWEQYVNKMKTPSTSDHHDKESTTVMDWSSYAVRLQKKSKPKQDSTLSTATESVEKSVQNNETSPRRRGDRNEDEPIVTNNKESSPVLTTLSWPERTDHPPAAVDETSPPEKDLKDANNVPSTTSPPVVKNRRFTNPNSRLRQAHSPIFPDVIERLAATKPASLQFMVNPDESDDDLILDRKKGLMEKVVQEEEIKPTTTKASQQLLQKQVLPGKDGIVESVISSPPPSLYPHGFPVPDMSLPSVSSPPSYYDLQHHPSIPNNIHYPVLMYPMRLPSTHVISNSSPTNSTGSQAVGVYLLPPGQNPLITRTPTTTSTTSNGIMVSEKERPRHHHHHRQHVGSEGSWRDRGHSTSFHQGSWRQRRHQGSFHGRRRGGSYHQQQQNGPQLEPSSAPL